MQSGGLKRGAAVVLAATISLAAMDVAAVQEQESEAGQAEDDDRALRRLPAFGALDTDDDDDISAAEMDAAAESLATLDEDGDGNLSADELRPRRGGPIGGPARTPPEATAAFMTFDADEDGLLERTELASQFRSLLTRADSDGDGAASEAEILALLTVEAEPPPRRNRRRPEVRRGRRRRKRMAGPSGPASRSWRRSTPTATVRFLRRRSPRPRSRYARWTPTATAGSQWTSCGPPQRANRTAKLAPR